MSQNAGETSPLAVEIVTTGTEILLGEIVDTNAAWIAQQLRDSGINLYYKTTVGDNTRRVRETIELGLSRSDVLLVTGGLGPTVDDITRQAIADATTTTLFLHEGALETLKARFERFGVQMTENNVQQAYIPGGSQLVENPVGTAPGFIVRTDAGTVIAMPGVPSEMKRMMQDTILPYLRHRNGDSGFIRRRVLRTIGIGESSIDHEIGNLMEQANPTVGLAAHLGQADVRITANAETEAEVESLLDEIEVTIRERIGDFIYSVEAKEPIEHVAAGAVCTADATISVVETNTGGNVAERLSTGVKGCDPVGTGAVLEPALAVIDEASALSAARELRIKSGADMGLAIYGTAGEDEGVWGSQQGETWIALDAPEGQRTLRIGYGGADASTIVRLGNSALALLWRTLRDGWQ